MVNWHHLVTIIANFCRLKMEHDTEQRHGGEKAITNFVFGKAYLPDLKLKQNKYKHIAQFNIIIRNSCESIVLLLMPIDVV